jgi:hypothetical protein
MCSSLNLELVTLTLLRATYVLLSAGNNRSEPGVEAIPHLFNFSVQPVSSVFWT